MTDLKSVIKKMDPIGQVFIKFSSVRTDDYEKDLDDKFVGCLQQKTKRRVGDKPALSLVFHQTSVQPKVFKYSETAD